jgi:hypothetical protein
MAWRDVDGRSVGGNPAIGRKASMEFETVQHVVRYACPLRRPDDGTQPLYINPITAVLRTTQLVIYATQFGGSRMIDFSNSRDNI